MNLGKAIGCVLLISAFLLAAAENAAQALAGQVGIMGIADVMEVLAPKFYDGLAEFVRHGLHPLVWDPVLLAVLAFPGWLLVGLPGAFLVWYNRARYVGDDEEESELPYTTYEDIVAAADEEMALYGDVEPSKYQHLHEYDPTDPNTINVDYAELERSLAQIGTPDEQLDLDQAEPLMLRGETHSAVVESDEPEVPPDESAGEEPPQNGPSHKD